MTFPYTIRKSLPVGNVRKVSGSKINYNPPLGISELFILLFCLHAYIEYTVGLELLYSVGSVQYSLTLVNLKQLFSGI